MNTRIIIGAIAAAAVIGGGIFFMAADNPGGQNTSPCADVCRHASGICPSLISQNDCNSKCAQLSEETKKHLQEATNCEQITSKPDLIADLIIPEAATPELLDKNTNDCEAACNNYVGKCLTLVPNATQALFAEGLASCLAECVGWDTEKVNCLTDAFDCEAMTNICGL